jgi:hypothetical protein
MMVCLVNFVKNTRLEKIIKHLVFKPIPSEADPPLLRDNFLLRRQGSYKAASMAWSGVVVSTRRPARPRSLAWCDVASLGIHLPD